MRAPLRHQLQRHAERLAELDFLLAQPDVQADTEQLMALSREHTEVAAVAGLGALAELELNHLDLRVGSVDDEFLFAERAIRIAAAKVARGHFPDQVTTMHAVVLADGAFARVVNESAHLGALVQRLNGIARQRTKAHGRNIEHTGVIGAGAGVCALLGFIR